MAVRELRSGGRSFGTMIRLVRSPGIAWIHKQASLYFIMLQIEAAAAIEATLPLVLSRVEQIPG